VQVWQMLIRTWTWRRSMPTVLSLALGALFVHSGVSKLFNLSAFSENLWNYRLLPEVLINPVAIWLPWLEAFAGAAVFAGVWRRGAALVLCVLLGIFTFAVAFSMARGLDITCGCSLPLSLSTRVGFPKFVENAVLLAAASVIFLSCPPHFSSSRYR